MTARRALAAEDFRRTGVPHRRVEAWKYSDLRTVVSAGEVETAGAATWSIEAEGVEMIAAGEGEFAGAMGEASLAFADAGFGLRVAKAGKVRVTFATPGQARVRIVVEPGAVLEYIETAEGDGFQNIGMDVSVGEGA